ncbi:MAG TPA: aminopeptidase P family protein [Gaiellaceae bacterium]|nr:aminopeptidase P family protein [Gaiellaceae bacterium]HWJ45834.1 aminopeptidase P family protein [Gaiellaceae bacterium]
MSSRIDRLQASLEEPLLVTNPTSIYYLFGFKSSNAALLVEPDAVRLFTDFRYAEAARAVPGVEFQETKRALLWDLASRLTGRIGFEADYVSYAGYETLGSGAIEPVPRRGLVERLRAVKDEQELAALRRACEITDRMFERLVEEPFIGRKEQDLAWTIEQLFHDEGADHVAFESIVASGPNAARPHARATSREIRPAETVVIDTGCTVDGYSSDSTRTFVTGPVDGVVKEAYAVVLAAQQAGLDAIRSGIAGVDADAAARRVVDETSFAGTFGHGLGHGLGLEVHEAPRMSTESTDTLSTGNVVTVEPGIYLEDRAGIRIEDNVVVTTDGIDNYTGFRKDLITVG